MTKPDTVGWHEGNCHCPICDDTTKQKARESARAAGNSVLVPADKLKDMQTRLQAAEEAIERVRGVRRYVTSSGIDVVEWPDVLQALTPPNEDKGDDKG